MVMKKIFIGFLPLFFLLLSSCEHNFEEVNTDPISVLDPAPEKLLAPAIVNMAKANMLRNRNFNNELMQVTVYQSEDENAVFRYDFRPTWADYTWNAWYSELTNFRDIYQIASTEKYENTAYKGVALINEVWAFSLLTDTYGDVPYTEANRGKEGIMEPKFDRQKDIYLSLFEKLEEANSLLAQNKDEIVPLSDPIYAGNVDHWRRFGNSLYLRLLLRVSSKDEVKAQVTTKIKDILQDNTLKYPIFENNGQSATVKWTGDVVTTDPFTNPYVIGLREADFTIASLCNFFILKLDEWNDPRIDISNKYGKDARNRLGIAPGSSGFLGVDSGYEPGGKELKQSYFYSFGGSEFSLQKSKLAGILMTYAEVELIKTEAIAKGWIQGDAAESYYKAIANSINYWVPQFTTDINNQEFTDYVATAGLQWDDNLPLDAGDAASKMANIQLQKYYVLFLTDFQQWFEQRRTGHPVLPKGAGLRNGGKMPVRLNYPVYIQSANAQNYRDAVKNMGADDINTLVWWQKP